jgi:hypothetical protein
MMKVSEEYARGFFRLASPVVDMSCECGERVSRAGEAQHDEFKPFVWAHAQPRGVRLRGRPVLTKSPIGRVLHGVFKRSGNPLL